ncbi:hypothetical protein SAMN04487830_13919 [Pseudobutyrivibrio sp. OR37]|uniref:hypothetical protein n=1 Tax=Pseudobutyrivibrio sp. OR37 TaxID=1798186 RepID=UPI0008E053A3|nr:hypothetical protein [Pseudobutyrivibrio sp. OR37]SFI30157.1 hypothetical protein SAMN04487830_13919 [Pseudobutyrivibrio sp. OR37]
MAYKYEFQFVNHGLTKEHQTSVNNEIWLDVGSSVELGVFDHHDTNNKYKSTVDLLFRELDLLEKTSVFLDKTQPVRVIVHKNPDTDALFSIFLVQCFLDRGREAFEKRFLETKLGEIVRNYVNDIDGGKNKCISHLTLYNLICNIDLSEVREQFGSLEGFALYNKEVEIAVSWIKKAVNLVEERMNTSEPFDLYKMTFPYDKEDVVAEAIEKVTTGYQESYNRDKIENKLVFEDISIWTKDGEIETVKAAIWNTIPSCQSTGYIYAREEGAVLTFVPHNESINGARISINPDIEGAIDKYSLRELAEMYEQLEQIKDKELFEKEGRLRRDYSCPRGNGNSGIFLMKPFSLTRDPWYVSSNGDMVDAPGGGTLISYNEQIEILENITKMVKKSFLVKYDLKPIGESLYSSVDRVSDGAESLLKWTSKLRNILNDKKDNTYPLVIAEVDAALISHNNYILDAYFMGLSDGGYLDADDKNVLRLDYRTHLYVNQSHAVLFIATSSETSNAVQMDGMLDWTDTKSVKVSCIVGLFDKILYQRERLKEIGRFLREFEKNEREVSNKNSELIKLLAKAQADECIDSQIEIDTYKFVYEVLNVSSLRENVRETTALVSEHTKERVYNNLNLISVYAIPFILLSTLFQIGLIEFKPIFSIGEDYIYNLIAWIVFLLITIVVTFVIRRGKK